MTLVSPLSSMTKVLFSFSLSPLKVLKMESQNEICSPDPLLWGHPKMKRWKNWLLFTSPRGQISQCDGQAQLPDAWPFLMTWWVPELRFSWVLDGPVDFIISTTRPWCYLGTSLPFALVGSGQEEMDHQLQVASASTPWLPSSLLRPTCCIQLHLGEPYQAYPALVNTGTQVRYMRNETAFLFSR